MVLQLSQDATFEWKLLILNRISTLRRFAEPFQNLSNHFKNVTRHFRPVESGSRLALGPDSRAVVPWRACRVRGRLVQCRQRRGVRIGYAGESQAASPWRSEACLCVRRT